MSEFITQQEQLTEAEVEARFNDLVSSITGAVSQEIIGITESEVVNKPTGTADQGWRED